MMPWMRLTGMVAERVFGFVGVVGREGADLGNARALGNSLLFCWLLPFFCCFLFYFGAACSCRGCGSMRYAGFC